MKDHAVLIMKDQWCYFCNHRQGLVLAFTSSLTSPKGPLISLKKEIQNCKWYTIWEGSTSIVLDLNIYPVWSVSNLTGRFFVGIPVMPHWVPDIQPSSCVVGSRGHPGRECLNPAEKPRSAPEVMCQNHPDSSCWTPLCPQSLWGLRMFISNKFPGNTDEPLH